MKQKYQHKEITATNNTAPETNNAPQTEEAQDAKKP